MHNLKRVFEEAKSADHAACDAGEDLLVANAALVNLVERTGVHVFHTVIDAALNEEGTVELHNLRGNSPVEDVELHEDPVELGLVELEVDLLHRHDNLGRLMEDPLDGAVLALAEFFLKLEL